MPSCTGVAETLPVCTGVYDMPHVCTILAKTLYDCNRMAGNTPIGTKTDWYNDHIRKETPKVVGSDPASPFRKGAT